MPQTLTPLPGAYAICRLPPTASLPAEPPRRPGLWSATRNADELSIVCRAGDAPADATHVDRPWCAFRLEGPFDLGGETGIIVQVANPLADAEIGVFVLATYDTDYVLIPAARAARAWRVLRDAGHTLQVPPTTIRPTTVADAPAIGELVRDTLLTYTAFAPAGWQPGGATVEEDRIAEQLGRDGTRSFVAAGEDGALRGVASLILTEEPGLGHVYQVFVDPGHQGSGLAGTLLDRLLDAAREDGLDRLRLYVARDGEQARAFYARAGWTADPDEGEAEGPQGLPVVLLRRTL